jgi:hypothetical protein
LNGVGGFLALAAWKQENAGNEASSKQASGTSLAQTSANSGQFRERKAQQIANINQPAPLAGSNRTYQYDKTKWQALLEFDPDISKVEAVLRPYGQKYVDQFAAGFLVLNDKAYIPNIIQKVIETARQDAAEAKAEEERWGKRFSDPAYVLSFAKEKFDFLASRPYGNVALLKDGSVLVEKNGQISRYSDTATLRGANRDGENWSNMPDEAKINFVRILAPHLPV